METIETAQQYLSVLQESVELTEIKTTHTNANISIFSNGVKFKYNDFHFELYKVSDNFLVEIPSESRSIFYNNGRYVFSPSEFLSEGMEFTEIFNARYELHINGNFIMFQSENTTTVDFIKNNIGLLNAFFTAKV